MPDLLLWFLAHGGGHPLLVALAMATGAGVLVRRRGAGAGGSAARIGVMIAAIACAALAAYATSAVWYASDDHYFDAAEPTMTIVGWLFTQGQPLYPAPAAAARRS